MVNKRSEAVGWPHVLSAGAQRHIPHPTRLERFFPQKGKKAINEQNTYGVQSRPGDIINGRTD